MVVRVHQGVDVSFDQPFLPFDARVHAFAHERIGEAGPVVHHPVGNVIAEVPVAAFQFEFDVLALIPFQPAGPVVF